MVAAPNRGRLPWLWSQIENFRLGLGHYGKEKGWLGCASPVSAARSCCAVRREKDLLTGVNSAATEASLQLGVTLVDSGNADCVTYAFAMRYNFVSIALGVMEVRLEKPGILEPFFFCRTCPGSRTTTLAGLCIAVSEVDY